MEPMEDMAYEEFLGARRAAILERVKDACARSGRDVSEITLLAVSKTVGPHEVELAHKVGYGCFGENRPQELSRKLSALRGLAGMEDVRYDMIGNLQTNKINQVLGQVELIHSVSSLHLAEAISKRAAAKGLVAHVLLETNVSGELSKSGFAPTELEASFDSVLDLEGIVVEGLMTMAPAHDAAAARATFGGLRELAERLRARGGCALPVLSCGMSDDYQAAIEEGSTLVRLGRVVFDPAYEMA